MSAELKTLDCEAMVRLCASLAADVWDEKRLSAHIAEVSNKVIPNQEQTLAQAVANLLGFEATDGSYTVTEYLDSIGWFHGWTHMRLVETMRAWLVEHHPERDEHDYAAARRAPRRTA
jgi:hypothetical protein